MKPDWPIAMSAAALLSWLASQQAVAQSSFPLCDKPTDFSSEVGPIKDQGGLGFCTTFATVTVLEQYACKNVPSSCALHRQGGLSVTDALAQTGVFEQGQRGQKKMTSSWVNSEYFREGALAHQVLLNVQEKGLCPSGVAPYPSEVVASTQMAAQLDQENVSAYLKKVVVGGQCEKQRVPFPPYKLNHLEPDGFSANCTAQEMVDGAFQQLQAGRALVFVIDTGLVFPENKSDAPSGHSIAVVGNKIVDGKCYLKVHNSWGEEWQKQHNDGWIDAERLLSGTKEVTWIEETQK